MTFIWLVVWLISHAPAVEMFGTWNNWGMALAVCVVIDLIGALSAGSWRRGRPYYGGRPSKVGARENLRAIGSCQ